MKAPADLHPAAGWACIAALVLAWDVLNVRSLTSHARAHPAATWIIGGVVSAHLLGRLPERVDPFHLAGRLVRP